MKQKGKQLLRYRRVLGVPEKDLSVEAKSMLIISNSDPKRFPGRGSVTFHHYWSPLIERSFDLNSHWILQNETKKKEGERERFKG